MLFQSSTIQLMWKSCSTQSHGSSMHYCTLVNEISRWKCWVKVACGVQRWRRRSKVWYIFNVTTLVRPATSKLSRPRWRDWLRYVKSHKGCGSIDCGSHHSTGKTRPRYEHPPDLPSVLLHCWLGHLTCKIVSEMTYNVSSGTLNPTILHTALANQTTATTFDFYLRDTVWVRYLLSSCICLSGLNRHQKSAPSRS